MRPTKGGGASPTRQAFRNKEQFNDSHKPWWIDAPARSEPARGAPSYGTSIMRITEMIVGILVVVAVLSYGTLAAVTLLN